MPRLFIFSVAAALLSGTALAADLPVYEPPPMEEVVQTVAYSWTGFYVGVNAGYQWSNDDINNTGTDTGAGGLGTLVAAPNAIPTSVGLDTDGFIGGGQIGYNMQMGMFVAGLEADIQWLDFDDSQTFANGNPAFFPFTTQFEKSIEWLGTVRGRVGLAVFERGLIFGTGGLAYGETRIESSFVCPACAPPANLSSSNSGVDVGWVAGGGVEYALTDHLSFKAEGLYYDLGDRSTTITYNYGANTSTLTSSTDFTGVIARGGVNWKF